MQAGLVARAIGTVAGGLIGWQVGSLLDRAGSHPATSALAIIIGAIIGLVLSPFVIQRPHRALRHAVSSMPASDLISAIIGLVLGLLAAALLSFPLSFLPWWFGHVLPAVAAVAGAYLGISFMMMRRREVGRLLHLGWNEMPEEQAASAPPKVLVDTSAIIDGRIADLAQTGFLQGTLVVPGFVLGELQHIADSPDALRRNRGRRGLDILNRMQKDGPAPVEIVDLDVRDVPEVDGKLVKLAQKLSCPVITNDFNLNRVAELQGVQVLNINQLANALKPVVLPGEEMDVHVIQEGKEYNQGVAYLDDGTMIVVENGRAYLDQHVSVIVTRVLQTVAGRMIFAHPKAAGRP